MSLNTSLSIATSGLKATQSQLSTVSNNIANADSAGYTKKTANTQSVIVAGQGAGVQVAETTSAVDQNLLRQRDEAVSTLGAAEVTASYSDSLQSSLGSTDGEDSLSDAVNGLANAIDALAVTPESSSESANVVHEAERLAGEVNALSDEIQDLRGQADKEIAESVEDVNAALHRIDDLNRQIADNEARGLSTADLEDQRAMELEALSRELDVTYFTNAKNQVQIYTASGTPLLDSAVHELQFSAASSVDSAIVYDPGGGSGLSGITVEGKDITGEITSGEIGGLLELRDDSLVDRQAEVDALTQTLADSVNAAHNQGTSLPAPSSLTGTTVVNGSDPLTASGTFRVAILDADGVVQQSV
ncbi:MAG TPA: flagellar hook-associated protein FlgK, partial [Kiloniellaceae bacterium]|nr:flagellar hook-associated protein FlgK [Kiloniellaceae bacterium]